MEYKYTTHSEKETIELAENFEAEKFPNMVICLDGDLGSGKTTFAKAFAKAMGIDEEVTSPTFTIVKEYFGGDLPLFHMDVYRIEDKVDELGIEEYFNKNGVTIIEWSDLIKNYLPQERIVIKFKIINENTRILQIEAHGSMYEDLCEDVL